MKEKDRKKWEKKISNRIDQIITLVFFLIVAAAAVKEILGRRKREGNE